LAEVCADTQGKGVDIVECDSEAADHGVPQHHSPNRFAQSLYNVRVFNMALGLYPLLSCTLNFTGSILDIWLTKNPVPTELVCAFLPHPRAIQLKLPANSNGDSRSSVRLFNLFV
jgi:hypothetical protein